MDSWSDSLDFDDEFEKLVYRVNPPRVTVDNTSSGNATVVKVDSANKHGSLLEVVQVLTDLNLTISRAYISSDGEWFMDVFHVIDQDGNKIQDEEVISRIQHVGLKTLSCFIYYESFIFRTLYVEFYNLHPHIYLSFTFRA
eukprot:TRINITY_DN10400_c0_g1_i2.p1 TRINITY_DN10400_c0_g1~~TRINITY_DN10400_c0_g1_i2.p1  ORF type:complete len:141 (-),score=30.21 TRINITY_DN10400_c0_g1_i2:601-1023(-)